MSQSEKNLFQCEDIIGRLTKELERNKEKCKTMKNRYYILYNTMYLNSNGGIFNPLALKDCDDYTNLTITKVWYLQYLQTLIFFSRYKGK